jgi:hypothetical protein
VKYLRGLLSDPGIAYAVVSHECAAKLHMTVGTIPPVTKTTFPEWSGKSSTDQVALGSGQQVRGMVDIRLLQDGKDMLVNGSFVSTRRLD